MVSASKIVKYPNQNQNIVGKSGTLFRVGAWTNVFPTPVSSPKKQIAEPETSRFLK